MIGFVVTFHYPLNHHPARLAAEHLEGFWFGWTSISRAFSIAQSCLFVAASLAVAMVVRSPAGQAAAGGASPGAPAILLPVFLAATLGCLSLCDIEMCTHDNFAKDVFSACFCRKCDIACSFSSRRCFLKIYRKTPRFCFLSSAWMHALAVGLLCLN